MDKELREEFQQLRELILLDRELEKKNEELEERILKLESFNKRFLDAIADMKRELDKHFNKKQNI